MRLVIVDFMPLLYRGHFAMLRKPRMTTWGFNSSALHFFVSSLFDFATKRGATHVALVSDCGPTFRHELYPQYKAQRDKMPEEIAASTRFVVKVLPVAMVTPGEPSSLVLPQTMLLTARPPVMRRPALPFVEEELRLATIVQL